MTTKNIFGYLRLWLGGSKKKNRIKGQLSDYEIENLRNRLNLYMNQHKPYLHTSYRIKDMASDLGIPAHQLSAFINRVLRMHFSDYINKARVEYCRRLIKSKHGEKQNMKELAVKCGFNNRNTFTTAFKKFTGHKPSEFAKSE